MLNDQLFAASFHASPIGQYLLAPTDKLEILAVNDTFLRSVSRRREEVLGCPLFDAFPNNPDDPLDFGVQSLGRSIKTAIESGRSQSMAAQYYPIHGGSVRAESAGLGLGTRFTICLPKIEPEVAVPASEPRPAIADALGTLSILLVDDNEDALMMLDMLLSSLGHRVTSTSSSRDGLHRAEADAPDVCILDIGLPDIDGFALARELRANARTRHATLIALPGYGQDIDRAMALEAGFDQYYVKPVDVDVLAVALAKLGAQAR